MFYLHPCLSHIPLNGEVLRFSKKTCSNSKACISFHVQFLNPLSVDSIICVTIASCFLAAPLPMQPPWVGGSSTAGLGGCRCGRPHAHCGCISETMSSSSTRSGSIELARSPKHMLLLHREVSHQQHTRVLFGEHGRNSGSRLELTASEAG